VSPFDLFCNLDILFMKHIIRIAIIIMLVWGGRCAALPPGQIQVRKWHVGNDQREALLYIPASARQMLTPVIFVFHGHGGNMNDMYAQHRFDKLWPEAIIVYAQGLNTPGKLVDRKGLRSGWQQSPGNMDDRDIHFFDNMLLSLKSEYRINSRQIFATGHSNGGGFTYLLWAMRENVFAAFAPSAAVAGYTDMLKAKPVIHIIGTNDPLVKPAWQEAQISQLKKLNTCAETGRPYARFAEIFSSALHHPVVVYQHPGKHVYPQSAEPVVVQFFKSISKNEDGH
jgi:polyhydroxybutyrate depolymerase